MRNFKKGFTLIEVVIVLAIAALIMVIVFLAVQGAQRSQRDTATKDTAARLLGAANVYASNNTGTFPGAAQIASLTAATPAGYGVVLPSGATIVYANTLPSVTGVYNLFAAKCDGTTPGFAVRYYQEQGGSQCLGN